MRNSLDVVLDDLDAKNGRHLTLQSMLDVVGELTWQAPGLFEPDGNGGQYHFSTVEGPCSAKFIIGRGHTHTPLRERLATGAPTGGVTRLAVAMPQYGVYLKVYAYTESRGPLNAELTIKCSEPVRHEFKAASRAMPQPFDLVQHYHRCAPMPEHPTQLWSWFTSLQTHRKVGSIYASMLLLEAAIDFGTMRLQPFRAQSVQAA